MGVLLSKSEIGKFTLTDRVPEYSSPVLARRQEQRRPLRMTKRIKHLIIAALFLFASALVWAFGSYFVPLHHDAAIVAGVELGPDGAPTREIVFEASYRKMGYLPGPEGGKEIRCYQSHFFLLQPGVPTQELAFLTSEVPHEIVNAEMFRPVRNSALWVVAFYELGSPVRVLVFDPTGIRTIRSIPGGELWFEDGNRTARFPTNTGLGSYDVVSDTVTQ
jgi:hypothetical protein